MRKRRDFLDLQTSIWVLAHYACLAVLRLVTVGLETQAELAAELYILLDHFGVVKAFLEADLLPRVISGTSAGGLVAALVCCYTDAELRRILVPELANRLTASEEPIKVWLKRVWQTGARFDSVTWAKKVRQEFQISSRANVKL